MTYDPKCYELATYFLADRDATPSHKDIDAMAQSIQQTIEDCLDNVPEPDEPDPDRMLEDRRERDRDEWRHEAAEQQRLK